MRTMKPGYEAWVTRDYGSKGKALILSKSRLGLFVYHVLRMGGEITSVYAMNPNYDRSYVQMAITLPIGRRKELQDVSGIVLESVPVLKPA